MKKKQLLFVLLLSALLLGGCTSNKKPTSSSTDSSTTETSSSSGEDETSKLEGTIEERLNQLKCVSSVKSIFVESKKFAKVFKISFKQYIDHNHKELGTFNQKVELGFNNLSKPTVYVTSGYMTNDTNYQYQDNENEIAFLLKCNYLFVEHRYFGKSTPVDIDYDNNQTWDYLNTEQAAADAHYIVSQFKRVLDGKWVSTGISKGGMTTELFAYYHPGDMDLYVPYVAPFCNSFADQRFFKFIYEEAGDEQYGKTKAAEMRQNILSFQIKMLEYRSYLAPRFYEEATSSGEVFSDLMTQDNLYDASVLEFGVGFWQYYQTYSPITSCLNMSEITLQQKQEKREAFYDTFTNVISPSDVSINNPFTPYYIQAYQELGNYGYDFSYIRNALPNGVTLTVQPSEDTSVMWNLVLNEAQRALPRKELMGPKIEHMLETTEDQFIILYGSSDPWYSVRPQDVEGRDNISIYVNTSHPHTTNIANFDTVTKNEILNKIKTILEVQ